MQRAVVLDVGQVLDLQGRDDVFRQVDGGVGIARDGQLDRVARHPFLAFVDLHEHRRLAGPAGGQLHHVALGGAGIDQQAFDNARIGVVAGGLARVLELPQTGWLRRYRVRVHGAITQPELDKLKEGIAVDGVLYGSIDAVLDRQQGSNQWLTLALREGKNREVKNVLGALGLSVNRLIRISYGPFQLGEIPEGQVHEIRGRLLRDQLGPRLIEASGADFDAPIVNRQQHADKADDKADSKPDGKPRPRGEEGKHREVRQRRAPGTAGGDTLDRLVTRPGQKSAKPSGRNRTGKPSGRSGNADRRR